MSPSASAPPAPAAAMAGRCTIVGTSGPDMLRGTWGDDVICGRGGDDRLMGRGGNDVLRGGGGDDLLRGGGSDDLLRGGGGDDVARGGGGDDQVVGGTGNDRLRGYGGVDVLNGLDSDAFVDRLICGPDRVDKALADGPDVVEGNCELVVRNDAPTDLRLTPSSVAENRPAGTPVGQLSAIDPDAGDDHSFALVPGTGSGDNASFTIEGDALKTAAVLDFETDNQLSIRVLATDGDGATYAEALTVAVTNVSETAPVAVDDSYSVAEDTELTRPLSGAASPAGNDTDAEGDALTVTAVANATGGTATISGGQVRFMPASNSCAPPAAGFDYTVSDGNGGTDSGHVTVTVTCVDDRAVAVDDTATVDEDASATAVPVRANDTDLEGDTISIVSVLQPDNGVVVITGGGTGLTYAPDADYCNSGPASDDTFAYTINGGDTATVSVTVTCVDDAPVAVDDTATVGEDSAAASLPVLANDTDVDAGALSIVSVNQPGDGAVVITGGGAGLTYEPDPGYCNSGAGPDDEFTYTLNGGDTATVSVTVTCQDDAPVAVNDSATVLEDAAASAIDVRANDTDTDGGPLTVDSVTQPDNGTVVITGGGTGVTYAPDLNFCNAPPGTTTDDFTYTLNGGDTDTVAVTVTCVNDTPVAVDDSATVLEDASASAIDVLADDTDVDGGAPISIGSVTQPDNGLVVITGGGTGLMYTPDANYCNSGAAPDDTFTYTINGGDTASVSVTVTCVDDAPVATDDSATVTEDDSASDIAVRGNDSDVDGDAVSIVSVTQPDNGLVVVTGGGTGLTYTPVANYCNSGAAPDDTFTYTINGGDTATVSVTVTCVNDAPVAVDDAATVSEDSSATAINVLADDTDVEGDSISILSVTQPDNGSVVITGGGTGLTYTPVANYCNSGAAPDDTFTYTINGGDTATVSVTVSCVNDDSVAVDDAATVAEDASPTAVPVRVNDTDVEGDTVSILSVTQPDNGAVVITGGGSGLTYGPDANYCNSGAAPDDTFTYTINGGDSATVSMTVTCVDDLPQAVDDSTTLTLNDPATAIDVLANDTDIDSGPISIESVTQPGDGVVAITGGGTGLTYDPDTGYCDDLVPDTFTYSLNGGSTATVSVTVACDLAPVAVNDSATVLEDAAASAIDVRANDTDADGGPMTVDSVTQPDNGTVVITGGGTGVTYAPDLNFCNAPPGTTTDDFTYTLNGGNTATVAVTVTCVDDAPVAVDDSATVLEDDSASAIDVLADDTDVDGGAITIGSVTQPDNGVVVITGGGTALTYGPDANYCNSGAAPDDTFTYTINGGDTATVSVTVTCVNDSPAVDTSAGSTSYTENAPATVIDASIIITDPDAGTTISGATVQISGGFAGVEDILALSGSHPDVTALVSGDTLTLTGSASPAAYQAALRDVTYRNSSDSPSTAGRTITFTVTDQTVLTGSDTKGITVSAVDDPPTAVNDSATLLEDAAATAVPVLANDTDIDGGPKSVASITQPANGTVVITGGGTGLTYQPNPNYCNDPLAAGDDTFTYTLNGGSVATVSMTVTCVNDAPAADDETFNGVSSAVGNTALVVNDPDDAAPALAAPKKSISGDVLAGDTDVDGPGPLTVTPGTFATNDGGSVTIEADGDFTYVPATGTSCSDASDFFDYTVTDDHTPTAGTDSGRVTVAVTGCVWYVHNNSPGNSGSSTAPFDTLAQAETASGAGHTIFVFDGDDTTTGLAAGITLKANQVLTSQAADLVVGADTLWTGAAGTRPTLTDTNADVVELDDNNTVRGFVINPQGAGSGIAGATGDTGGGTIDNVSIVDTATPGTQPLLELDATLGTFNVSNFDVDNSGATTNPSTATGIRLNNAGTVVFAPASAISLTTEGSKAIDATGTALGTSTFDGVMVTASSVGGVAMASTTGNTTFANLSLTTTSGAAGAFVLSSAGTVTVPDVGTANVSALGGPAVDVTGTAGATLAFDDVDSINSSTDGVNLAGLGVGTFTANTSSSIANAGGIDFDLDGGGGNVTFDGAITDDQGQLVRVQNTTGATKDFNGAITDGGDGDGGGIALTSNTGATVRFDGGLTLATGANPAFAATGGGTLAVTDPNATGSSPDNTIATTTSTALNVTSTAIAADDLTFRSISSNGGSANGIILSATGGAGGLHVTGNGTAGSGGTIANKTGADGSFATEGTGVYLNDTDDVQLDRMQLNDFSNFGIRGTAVIGFSLANSTVTATASALNGTDAAFDEGSVRFIDLTGTATFSAVTISRGFEDNLWIENQSGGVLSQLTVSNSTISNTNAAAGGNNGLLIKTNGGSITADVTGSSFLGNRANGIQVITEGTGSIDVEVGTDAAGSGGTFTNNNIGVNIDHNSSGTLRFNVKNATLSTPGLAGAASPINVNRGGGVGSVARGLFQGNIVGNVITNNNSLVGPGMRIIANGCGGSGGASNTMRVRVQSNNISQVANLGIEVRTRDGNAVVDAVITGNTVQTSTAGALEAIRADAGATSANVCGAPDDGTINAHISGNTASTAGPGLSAIRVRQRFSTTYRLQGYVGAATDDVAVANFLSAANGGASATADHTLAGSAGFLNIADVTDPVP